MTVFCLNWKKILPLRFTVNNKKQTGSLDCAHLLRRGDAWHRPCLAIATLLLLLCISSCSIQNNGILTEKTQECLANIDPKIAKGFHGYRVICSADGNNIAWADQTNKLVVLLSGKKLSIYDVEFEGPLAFG